MKTLFLILIIAPVLYGAAIFAAEILPSTKNTYAVRCPDCGKEFKSKPKSARCCGGRVVTDGVFERIFQLQFKCPKCKSLFATEQPVKGPRTTAVLIPAPPKIAKKIQALKAPKDK